MEHHCRGLLRASRDEALVRAVKENPRTADVGPKRRAVLDYVITLTETPWAVRKGQVDAMKEQGWSDQAVLIVNLVACYFAWCNRVVDGLGVPMEESWPEEIRAREEEFKATPK